MTSGEVKKHRTTRHFLGVQQDIEIDNHYIYKRKGVTNSDKEDTNVNDPPKESDPPSP